MVRVFVAPEVKGVLRHGERLGDGGLHLVDGLRGADDLVLAVLDGADEARLRLEGEVVLRADVELALHDLERACFIIRH